MQRFDIDPAAQMVPYGQQLSRSFPPAYLNAAPCLVWPRPYSLWMPSLLPEIALKIVEHLNSGYFNRVLEQHGAFVEFGNEANALVGQAFGHNRDGALACDRCSEDSTSGQKVCSYETTFSYSWDGSPEQFYWAMASTIRGLKQLYPEISLGGPGLEGSSACPHLGLASKEVQEKGRLWITNMLNYMRKTGTQLDFFSYHIYTDDPAVMVSCYEYLDEILESYGFGSTPHLISEWNVPPQFESAEAPYHNGAAEASKLTALWITMQTAMPKVAQSYFYRSADGPFVGNGPGFPVGCQDFPVNPSKPFPSSYGAGGLGLLNIRGELKPNAAAFSLWNQLRNSYIVHYDTGDSYSGPYFMYAIQPDVSLLRPRSAVLLVLVSTSRSKAMSLNHTKLLLGFNYPRQSFRTMFQSAQAVEDNAAQVIYLIHPNPITGTFRLKPNSSYLFTYRATENLLVVPSTILSDSVSSIFQDIRQSLIPQVPRA
eukprot:GHVT01099690.1.p1 GENE.GHVT01099690.1~~GHVT01099690.1.p1  ORF type:complete len:483 (-),score=17.04 GHVT01099690.1:378-1826(-)